MKYKIYKYFLLYGLGFHICENNFCKVQRTYVFL